ncbi:hypothetical protein [Roseateles sp.]|uniref:phage tail tube protein n=1 Tax=Roseateles sp. TaxID=1971397 RepID=UPI002F3ED6F8
MTLLASNVRVGITGELSVAPVGTAAPTTSISALNAAFVGLGYVSEDGVTETPNDTIENIVAWQRATVVRALTTESFFTFTLTLIETKGEVVELYYKGSTIAVVSAGQWKVEVGAAQSDPRAFVLDVVDGSKHYRTHIGNGEVTERGEIVYASGEPIGYEITITAYADANGVLFTKYADDANWGYS